MAVRIGFLGIAHMHARSYVGAFRAEGRAEISGAWDAEPARLSQFSRDLSVPSASSPDDLLARCDAVVICSPNRSHAGDVELAAKARKPILCEKPVATTEEEAKRISVAAKSSGAPFMAAFPCRLSPAYQRLKERVKNGDIGEIRAVCATNRGRCPFDWFVAIEKSGGGAMIDHTVHVADLLFDLLGEEPESVRAQVGSNMYGEHWEDTAMLTLQYKSGAFATIDSSWSRPKGYKTWGDVTMNVVGDKGVIELDMFAQQVQAYGDGSPSHTVADYSSSLDALMVRHFLDCVETGAQPITSLDDGLRASRVAIAGYRSLKD